VVSGVGSAEKIFGEDEKMVQNFYRPEA
jgi:hypothetical protein